MLKFSQTIESVIFFMLAIVLAWLGVSIPVHFKAISPALLERAAEGTPSIQSLTIDYIETAQVGPVRLLWQADPRLQITETERMRMRRLLEEHPLYWHSGGPAPYYEAYLRLINPPTGTEYEKNVVEMLLPARHREVLTGYLQSSANATVQRLLEARSLTGWMHFLPVSSPAGHPLDSALLTTALLVQADVFGSPLRRELQALLEDSFNDNRQQHEQLETFLMAVISIGRRMDWVQISELIRRIDSVDEFIAAGQRLSVDPKSFPQVYAATLLINDFAQVDAYLEEHGDEGREAIALALLHGQGALSLLFESDKQLYYAPGIIQWLDRPLGWIQDRFLLALTLEHPTLALNLKIVLLLMAGLSLALSFGRIGHMIGLVPNVRKYWTLKAAGNAAAAIAFTAVLSMLIEPALLEFGKREAAELALDFKSLPHESLESQTITPTMIDQATVIVLLFFFFLQMMVYILGLLKLNQIRRQKLEPQTKIVLLENEENLFDLGLYLGLGGTVASLILLAMNIAQVSLVAAYSSTLFGILFSAALKILHVRAFRRQLILEQSA